MSNKIRDLREKFFQIDDEYLNGYAKLCGINATGVYFSMCRHANKQQTCFPSKKLIAKELAISERSVYTAIKKLEKWNIIKIERQGRKKNGSFKNLLYTLLDKKVWISKPSANGAVGNTDSQPSATGAVDRRQQVPNKDTHINYTHIKETHIAGKPAKNEINQLLKYFYELNPVFNFGNKTQRKTISDIIKKFGYEKTEKIIQYAISIQGEKYAPIITTPIQLKNKLGNLLIFYKKQNGSGKVVEIL